MAGVNWSCFCTSTLKLFGTPGRELMQNQHDFVCKVINNVYYRNSRSYLNPVRMLFSARASRCCHQMGFIAIHGIHRAGNLHTRNHVRICHIRDGGIPNKVLHCTITFFNYNGYWRVWTDRAIATLLITTWVKLRTAAAIRNHRAGTSHQWRESELPARSTKLNQTLWCAAIGVVAWI